MSDLFDAVRSNLSSPGPTLVGIGGAVGVGKSTIADSLVKDFERAGLAARILSTDAFLLPNAILDERHITHRKGFPESYDTETERRVLDAIRTGRWPVDVPVYSHDIYDIVTGTSVTLDPCDVVLVDGIVALQEPVVDFLDLAIYIDADESVVREWFVHRFLRFVDDARDNEASFYRTFVDMAEDDVRSLAVTVWDGINGVNLREHIGPSIERATLVVSKGVDHEIVRLSSPG